MHRRFARSVCASLAVATFAMALPGPAQARTLGTEEVLGAAAAPSASLQRDTLRGLLDRDDVRRQLVAHGVDVVAARERVDALTDAEVEQLAGRVGTLPAGGSSVITCSWSRCPCIVIQVEVSLGSSPVVSATIRRNTLGSTADHSSRLSFVGTRRGITESCRGDTMYSKTG